MRETGMGQQVAQLHERLMMMMMKNSIYFFVVWKVQIKNSLIKTNWTLAQMLV